MAEATPNPAAPAAPTVPPVQNINVPANPGPAPAHPQTAPGGFAVPEGYELRRVETNPARPPQYLSTEQMANVIRAGGSVLHHDRDDQGRPTGDSRLISKVEHLPGAAQLAKGDPEAEKRARADLEAQRAQIDAQLAKLDKPESASPEAPATPEATQTTRTAPTAKK
jgi:hypothetical protein